MLGLEKNIYCCNNSHLIKKKDTIYVHNKINNLVDHVIKFHNPKVQRYENIRIFVGLSLILYPRNLLISF